MTGLPRSGWLGSVAVIAICAPACTEFGARPRSPAEGGAQWVRVESEHLTVVSDLPRDEAESTAQELEGGLGALTQVVFEHPRVPVEHTTVVIFSNSSDFHAFMPEMVEGRFYPRLSNDPEGPRFLVAHGKLSADNRIVFYHELAHDLIDRNFGSSPPWLREGWAEYYSSLRIDGDDIVFGERARHITFTEDPGYFRYSEASGLAGLAIPINQVPAPSVLVHLSQEEFYRQALAPHPSADDELKAETNYAASWALVHMLLDGPEPYQRRFKTFLQEAVSGDTLDVAFQKAFGALPSTEFDTDFRRYLARREIVVSRAHYARPSHPSSVTSRVLTDAEVHLYWAFLTPWRGPSSDPARRDLDAAVAAAPAWPDGIYYRGIYFVLRGEFQLAERDIEAAVKMSPDDSRFLLGELFLRVVREQATHTGHLESILDAADRLKRVAHTATELNAAADILRRFGRLVEALELARRAVHLAPVDPAVLDTFANVLFDLGRVDDAITFQTAAVSYLDEHTKDRGFIERLALYRSRAK